MKGAQLSAVIMARDEEDNIGEAIASLSFASQIVVADTGSKDRTMDLARKAGAEVHSILFDGYGTSKNRALEFCSHDWILCLDADERATRELADEIIGAINGSNDYDGFEISRLSYFLGKPIRHSGWYPDYVLRLFRRTKGRYSERLVHEKIELKGKIGRLKSHLLHYSYSNLDSYLEKMNAYSTLNAAELRKKGYGGNIVRMIIHPPATFIKMYLFKVGFLDGYRGFLLALLSSLHVFVKYAKLREIASGGENN